MKLTGADIILLKTCRCNLIILEFMHVKVTINNWTNDKVTTFAKQKWLDLEMDYLYLKRGFCEVETCNLFKHLTFKINNVEFEE